MKKILTSLILASTIILSVNLFAQKIGNKGNGKTCTECTKELNQSIAQDVNSEVPHCGVILKLDKSANLYSATYPGNCNPEDYEKINYLLRSVVLNYNQCSYNSYCWDNPYVVIS